MAIRYINKHGGELTPQEWQRLYRDPAYYVLRRRFCKDNKSWVAASWVGVWSPQYEANPLLFFVEHYRWVKDDAGREDKQEIKHGWCGTEKAAIETAKRWEQ